MYKGLMMYDEELAKNVPPHTLDSLMRYVEEGCPPGDFLRALLSNDLRESFGRADLTNRYSLFDIVMFLHNCCPSDCWESEENYRQWIKKFSKTKVN